LNDVRGPLAGIRVLDLTTLLPGPFATLLLADLGADVIKVESRLGDLLRQVPPLVAGRGALFMSLNRNKRALGLDMRRPTGRDLLLRLAAEVDVVVEGFRPGRAARLGIDPAGLRSSYPELVVCSLSGFGQTGPDAKRPGHDATYLARGGVLADSRPGERPQLSPLQVADMAAGTTAALGIVTALLRRSNGGGGGVVDLGILDTVAAWMGPHLHAHQTGATAVGEAPPLSGRYPFYNVYPTLDGGHVALGALEPLFWRDFCLAVDRPDLVARQFDAGDDRRTLFEEVTAIFGARTNAWWADLIRRADLAAEVAAGPDEVLADAQLQARGMILEVAEPGGHIFLQTDTPLRMDSRPPNAAMRAPELGEHSREVLAEVLGLADAEIAGLVDASVVFESTSPGRKIAPAELP
jgi:alpha-methylacyl-CoA racemase